MNAELLYTSAPQGLKQGSRGFCTVLSTVGMPLNIATKLESLSGYRHLYPSGTPDAVKNPVSYSHLKLSVGGRMISVISRISDYGLDYSQRTNKLAHHIVVDAPLPTCGPAALLADPSVMRTQWDGNCINVPAPPALSAASADPAPCSAWEAITGDAGWGGVLANAWLNPASKPIFVVFSEDQSVQVLSLIEEAISLLPPAKRWQATFGTYVTNLPPDVDCKVRCVVSGSEEARMASARGVVINLTQASGPAPPSEAVTAARNGTIIGGLLSAPPSRVTVDRDETQVGAPPIGEPIEDNAEYSQQASATDFDLDNPFGSSAPDLPPSMRSKGARSIPMFKGGGKRSSLKLVLGALALAATILVVFGIVSFSRKLSELSQIVEANNTLPESFVVEPKIEQTTNQTPTEPDAPDKVIVDPDKVSAKVDNPAINPGQAGDPPVPLPAPQPATQSKNEVFLLSRLSVVLGEFAFPIKTGTDSEELLPLGVIGAKAKAEVKYNCEDQEEQDRFQKWASDPESFKWLWYESDDSGKSWIRRSDIESSEIEIESSDKPNKLFYVEIEMKNQPVEGAEKDKKLKIGPSNKVRTEDYTTIEIDAKQLFLKGKTLNIEPVFKEIKAPDGKRGEWFIGLIHTDRPTKLKDISIEELRVRMKAVECENDMFQLWGDLTSSLKNLNELRNDALQKFDAARVILRNRCDSQKLNQEVIGNRLRNGIGAHGLLTLRSSKVDLRSDMGYFDTWNTNAFAEWFNNGSSLREITTDTTGTMNAAEVRAFNIELKIFQDAWFGNGKDDIDKIYENIVSANVKFMRIRDQLLNKEFLIDKPLPVAGLFSESKNSSVIPSDLQSQEKAISKLKLWYRIRIKAPTGGPEFTGAGGY
ncbi:MAG: hypothetical protein RL240_3639 [Planctomycetota bacterium]